MFANRNSFRLSLSSSYNKSKFKIKSENGQTANNDDETCSYGYDSD